LSDNKVCTWLLWEDMAAALNLAALRRHGCTFVPGGPEKTWLKLCTWLPYEDVATALYLAALKRQWLQLCTKLPWEDMAAAMYLAALRRHGCSFVPGCPKKTWLQLCTWLLYSWLPPHLPRLPDASRGVVLRTGAMLARSSSLPLSPSKDMSLHKLAVICASNPEWVHPRIRLASILDPGYYCSM
jgi:hypothetical protein